MAGCTQQWRASRLGVCRQQRGWAARHLQHGRRHRRSRGQRQRAGVIAWGLQGPHTTVYDAWVQAGSQVSDACPHERCTGFDRGPMQRPHGCSAHGLRPAWAGLGSCGCNNVCGRPQHWGLRPGNGWAGLACLNLSGLTDILRLQTVQQMPQYPTACADPHKNRSIRSEQKVSILQDCTTACRSPRCMFRALEHLYSQAFRVIHQSIP